MSIVNCVSCIFILCLVVSYSDEQNAVSALAGSLSQGAWSQPTSLRDGIPKPVVPFRIMLINNFSAGSDATSAFTRTVYELRKSERYSNYLEIEPIVSSVYETVYHSLNQVCGEIERNNYISAFITNISKPAFDGLSIVAQYLRIPIVDLKRQYHVQEPSLSKQLYLSMYPSIADSPDVIVQFLQRFALYEITVVSSEFTLSSDIFMRNLQKALKQSQVKMKHQLVFSKYANLNIAKELVGISSRTVLLHLEVDLIGLFFDKLRLHADLIDVNSFVWLTTELSYTTNQNILRALPIGSLILLSRPLETNNDVLASDVITMLAEGAVTLRRNEEWEEGTQDYTCLPQSAEPSVNPTTKNGILLHRQVLDLGISLSNGNRTAQFNKYGYIRNGAYDLLNLVQDSATQEPRWAARGSYENGKLVLDSIIWSQDSYRIPHSIQKFDTQIIKLVVKNSKPFVDVTGQFNGTLDDELKCAELGLVCYEVDSTQPDRIRDMLYGKIKPKSSLCCYGLTIELIKQLSKDLGFSYKAYLTPEASVGKKINGSWMGMIGDLIRGSADMAAGATSITPERTEAVDFTVPYYLGAFGTLSSRKPPYPALGAFLDPFSWQMWILIFLFVHVTAIFMALFEWLSPYGLHPHGRNRLKTFSFPSGLLHTWSLLFSHTYNSKSPKSVASRFIVNAWGMFAVVFIAGYTANLASFMAGRMLDPNIDISKLRYPGSSVRFATVNGTSTDYYLKLYFPQRWKEMRQLNVADLDEGVDKLRKYAIEALMFDAPQVNFRAASDPECKLIAAGSNFWSDTYGLAFPRGSPLRDKVSDMIVQYEAAGLMTTWQKKWLSDKQSECYSPLMQHRYRLSVNHARGVFVLILVGSSVSLATLLGEWLVYKWLVPRLRGKRREGKWKYVLFLSQRLNASLKSSSLVPAGKSFRRAFLSASTRRNSVRLQANNPEAKGNLLNQSESRNPKTTKQYPGTFSNGGSGTKSLPNGMLVSNPQKLKKAASVGAKLVSQNESPHTPSRATTHTEGWPAGTASERDRQLYLDREYSSILSPKQPSSPIYIKKDGTPADIPLLSSQARGTPELVIFDPIRQTLQTAPIYSGAFNSPQFRQNTPGSTDSSQTWQTFSPRHVNLATLACGTQQGLDTMRERKVTYPHQQAKYHSPPEIAGARITASLPRLATDAPSLINDVRDESPSSPSMTQSTISPGEGTDQ